MDNSEEITKQIADLKTVLLDTIKYVQKGFKAVDENFEAIDKSLKAIDGKVELLIKESNEGFGQVGEKIDELKVEVNKIQKVSNYSEEYANLLRISK